VHFLQEGRAGRLIPNHWKPDVNYAFGAHDADFRAGEEVVLRRGDGSLRFARVEAQYQDEVVLVLGPDPNIKPSGKKDKVSAVPFRLVKRSEAGKLILDDWVPHDEAQPPEDEDMVCASLSLSLARSLCVCVCVSERARRERRGSNVYAIRCGARGVSLGLSCPLPLPHVSSPVQGTQ